MLLANKPRSEPKACHDCTARICETIQEISTTVLGGSFESGFCQIKISSVKLTKSLVSIVFHIGFVPGLSLKIQISTLNLFDPNEKSFAEQVVKVVVGLERPQ